MGLRLGEATVIRVKVLFPRLSVISIFRKLKHKLHKPELNLTMTSKVIGVGSLVFQENIEVQSDEENEQPTTEDENTTENNTGIESNDIDDEENKDLIVID